MGSKDVEVTGLYGLVMAFPRGNDYLLHYVGSEAAKEEV